MTRLGELLQRHVDDGSVPGAVALLGRGDAVDVQAVGFQDAGGSAPMSPESIFRIASITKPITAAAVLVLAEEGRFALDEPVTGWLPELALAKVVRTPSSPLDDLVPPRRPITVVDLLTSTAGYGFDSDLDHPAARALGTLQADGREVAVPPPPAEWMQALVAIPMAYHPGQAFLYNTCSDLQGVLIARATGQSLPDVLAERIFEPLGMADTGFEVPPAKRARFTSYYRRGSDGDFQPADGPDGQFATLPAFPSGAGGLVSTVGDWHTFARMLLGGGEVDGRRLLAGASVRRMMTNHLSPAQAEPGALFLEGQGWGFGGAVDIVDRDPWNVPGRYGWVGGTGTVAYVYPSTGAVAILLTQVGLDSPVPSALLESFCVHAAEFARDA